MMRQRCAASTEFVVGMVFFFSSRRRHTRCSRDWSSDVCSSDLLGVAVAAFCFGVACVAANFFAQPREPGFWKRFELPFEWYAVAFCATALVPENLRPSPDAGWFGLLGSRLTTISAIFGLGVLGSLKPRKWHLAGFSVCALIFFPFLYQDTGWLNRLEANAERLTRGLAPGTRVIVTIDAPAGSRI